MELQELTLKVTPEAIRVIKGYATLSGRSSEEITAEIADIVSTSIVGELKDKIAASLNLKVEAPKIPPKNRRAQAPVQQSFNDTTGISDGLGDQDEGGTTEPEPVPAVTDEDAFIPKQGGVTDEDLDNDLKVGNPEEEAAAEAPTFGESLLSQQQQVGDGTELFAATAGFVDPRIAKRKKKPGGKGRVTPLNHNYSEAADSKL